MLSIFPGTCWPPVCRLWKKVYADLLPTFNPFQIVVLQLSFTSSLCILVINSFSNMWLANIFSHSVDCLFIVDGSLSCALDAVSFFDFCFWSQTPQNSSLQLTSKSLLPVFSFRSLTVSGLTFKSLIHFELVFMYDVR